MRLNDIFGNLNSFLVNLVNMVPLAITPEAFLVVKNKVESM